VGLRRGFGPAAVGASSASPHARRGLGGGRRFSSLLAAGQRRWFKSEDAAEHPAHHCGGTSVSRQSTDAPRRRREPPSLRLLAEMPRDAGPPLEPWILRLASAAEADSRSPRSIKYAKTDVCLLATGRNPRRRRRRGGCEDATEPSGTAAGSC